MNLQQELRAEYARLITRRWFFRQCGVGLGSVALASLRGADKAAAAIAPANPMAPKSSPLTAKANRVIYLFMGCAPIQLDLFDHNPALAKYNGKPSPQEVVMGQKYAFI